MQFESIAVRRSAVCEGVEFRLRRMSFRRRLDLMRAVRDLAKRLEFASAGESSVDRAEAAITAMEIDDVYLRWGLDSVEGLSIDGQVASPDDLIAKGPEALCREIAEAIRGECGLSDDERKN